MERILEAPKWSISNMMYNPEKELAVYYQKQSFGSVQACNFIKKYTLAQVFTCEIWKNFKKTYFHRMPPVAAFVLYKILDFLQDLLHTKNLFKISCPLLFISFVRFIGWLHMRIIIFTFIRFGNLHQSRKYWHYKPSRLTSSTLSCFHFRP